MSSVEENDNEKPECYTRIEDTSADGKHRRVREYDIDNNLISDEEYIKQQGRACYGSVGTPSHEFSLFVKKEKTTSMALDSNSSTSNNE